MKPKVWQRMVEQARAKTFDDLAVPRPLCQEYVLNEGLINKHLFISCCCYSSFYNAEDRRPIAELYPFILQLYQSLF